MNAAQFCQQTVSDLARTNGEDYARLFCQRKMEFHRQFQNGLIFSTRFGADFFSETLRFINGTEYLKAEKGELGEYDKNFNACLKRWRVEKRS